MEKVIVDAVYTNEDAVLDKLDAILENQAVQQELLEDLIEKVHNLGELTGNTEFGGSYGA